MVDRETTAGRVMPDMRVEWQALAAPVLAVARFLRRKPLGAVGGLIVLALLVMALLALVLAPQPGCCLAAEGPGLLSPGRRAPIDRCAPEEHDRRI